MKPQFCKNLTRKTTFFDVWSWFKFYDLGLAVGTNLKFYNSVAKGLQLKVLGSNFYVCRSYKGKTGRGTFLPPILNRVKTHLLRKKMVTNVISVRLDILVDTCTANVAM